MKVNDRYCSFYYQYDDDRGELKIDKQKTALFIIDLQNYFCNRPSYGDSEREQQMEKAWKWFYDRIEDVVIPQNKRLLERFRDEKMLVAHARIASHLSDGADRSLVQKESGFNQLLLPKDSEPAQIVSPLKPIPDEIEILKTTDSAVTGSNIAMLLRNCGIDTVVVTGVFTDQCVSGTVRALCDESFHVWLIEDGCSAGNEEIQNMELSILNNIYCHVVNTEELLAALD